jgi:putative oxidoreductase
LPWVILLSRILMATIFVHDGFLKAMNPSATMAAITKYGLPLPGLGYAVALLVEVGAGLAFLLGWKGRTAALILAVWCVATAFVAHYHPGDRGQMIHFMKNLCMAGGFLQVVAYGVGAFSVDRR